MNKASFQRGATALLTVFVLLVAVAALGVLGVGQTVFERNEVQRVADLSALAAAAQIDDGPTFRLGQELASRNGLRAGDVLRFSCLANGQTTTNCQIANTVRATVSRPYSPYFLGPARTVSAEAEATLTPVVTGVVSSSLVNLSSQQSEFLRSLVRVLPGGASVNVSALNFNQLLGANVQVGVAPLATSLRVASLDALASAQVSAFNLLNESLNVAQGDPVELQGARGTLQQLSSVLSGVNVRVSDVLAMTLDNQSQGVVNVDFGQLALVTLLNAAQGRSISLTSAQLGLGTLGVAVDVTLLQSPQVFVGRKVPNRRPIAQGRVSQAAVRARISGLQVLGLSLAQIELATRLAGGTAQVDNLECRLPRSNNTLDLTVQPTAVAACVTSPGAINTTTLNASGSGLLTCPAQAASLVSTPLLRATVRGQASVQSQPQSFEFVGPAPYQAAVSLNASNALANVFSNLNLQVDVQLLGLGLGPLLNVAAVQSALTTTLSGVLGQVGGALDNTLGVLGLGLNNLQANINSVDCQAALLTK